MKVTDLIDHAMSKTLVKTRFNPPMNLRTRTERAQHQIFRILQRTSVWRKGPARFDLHLAGKTVKIVVLAIGKIVAPGKRFGKTAAVLLADAPPESPVGGSAGQFVPPDQRMKIESRPPAENRNASLRLQFQNRIFGVAHEIRQRIGLSGSRIGDVQQTRLHRFPSRHILLQILAGPDVQSPVDLSRIGGNHRAVQPARQRHRHGRLAACGRPQNDNHPVFPVHHSGIRPVFR